MEHWVRSQSGNILVHPWGADFSNPATMVTAPVIAGRAGDWCLTPMAPGPLCVTLFTGRRRRCGCGRGELLPLEDVPSG